MWFAILVLICAGSAWRKLLARETIPRTGSNWTGIQGEILEESFHAERKVVPRLRSFVMHNGVTRARILLGLLAITTPGSARPIADGIPEAVVISTSTPKYPPLAVVSGTKGSVSVDVAIDSEGRVLSAKALDGHPLLRGVAEVAAKQWRFNTASSNSDSRIARLTFVFDIVLDESTETRDEGVFIPPFRLQVTHRIATIAPLPRVAGKIPHEICALHKEELKLDLVPILYGKPASENSSTSADLVGIIRIAWTKLTHREPYFVAERNRFPNSQMLGYGGCIAGYERMAEVLYCKQCRHIERRWRKKHPGRGPEFVAVISFGRNN